jgi:branched-chain amino acid transport system permease protein
MDKSIFNSRKLWLPGVAILLLAALAVLPLYGSLYMVVLMTTILMYSILTVSWVMFSGPSGYLSLATAAFFGVGIYVGAILLPNTGQLVPLLVAVLIGGIASGLVALGVGALTLRLRGIYFAIFTFGLVILIQEVLSWYEHTVSHIRGRFVMLVSNDIIFYVMLGIFVATMLTFFFLRRSKFGLALQGIGQNEEAAAHSGVNVTMVKVLTFALSAFFAGAAGVIWATRLTYIDPYVAFSVLYSFLPVLMAIFGGIGQIYGPVIGAAVFAYLQEALQTEFPELYMLIFGFVLIGTVLFMPNGLVGAIDWARRKLRRGGSAVNNADT